MSATVNEPVSAITLDFPARRTGHKQIVARWPADDGTVASKVVGKIIRNEGKATWTALLGCRCGAPIRISGVGFTRTCALVENHLRTCGKWWS